MQVAFHHMYGEHGDTKAEATNRIVIIKQTDKNFDNNEHQIILTQEQVEMIAKTMKKYKA